MTQIDFRNTEADVNLSKRWFFITVGIILWGWAIFLYEKTFVQLWVPILSFLIPACIYALIIHKRHRIKRNKYPYNLHLIWAVFLCGGMGVYSILALNYYFALSSPEYIILKIEDSSFSTFRKGKPRSYVQVNYEGIEKDIYLPFDPTLLLKESISITVDTGCLGMKVIKKINQEE